MERETVVGIAWAVGLLLAMGGVFAYEAATFEMDTYDVSWGLEEASESGNGQLDEGASDDLEFQVSGQDLAGVLVRLSWGDGDDTFQVTLAGPGGVSKTADGVGGSLEVRVPAGDAREGGEVEAVDEDHAISQFEAGSPYDGTAAWTVTITLLDAPGQSVGGVELQEDGSEAYDFTFVHQHYVGEATRVE